MLTGCKPVSRQETGKCPVQFHKHVSISINCLDSEINCIIIISTEPYQYFNRKTKRNFLIKRHFLRKSTRACTRWSSDLLETLHTFTTVYYQENLQISASYSQ